MSIDESNNIDILSDVLAPAHWRHVSGNLWRGPFGEEVRLVGSGGSLRVIAADRHVEALLAEALLEAAAAPAPAVAVLLLKHVSLAQHERCLAFTQRVAPDARWILADTEGRCFVHAFEVYAAREPRKRAPEKQQVNLYSDLNQWLAKVLLAGRLPERLLTAPRERYRSAMALAEHADVSVPATTRFVRALSDQGWVAAAQPELMITAPDLYLRNWSSNLGAAKTHPYHRDVLVRSVRGNLDAESTLQLLRLETTRASSTFWMIGGLFTACEALGFGHVRGALPTLVVPELNASELEARGLVVDETGQSGGALLRIARYPETVFRGSVVVDGARVTDVIQCWLDTERHALRGQEQADYLWRKVIEPAIGDAR